jgi:hypothetical protein
MCMDACMLCMRPRLAIAAALIRLFSETCCHYQISDGVTAWKEEGGRTFYSHISYLISHILTLIIDKILL